MVTYLAERIAKEGAYMAKVLRTKLEKGHTCLMLFVLLNPSIKGCQNFGKFRYLYTKECLDIYTFLTNYNILLQTK